jgi:hypothetical protein
MKLLKLSFILLLVAAICALAGVAALRLPAVQMKIAQRYFGKRFNSCFLDKISVGASRAKISNLSLLSGNTDFGIGSLEIEWSLKDLLFLRELRIRSVVADRVTVHFHEVSPHSWDNYGIGEIAQNKIDCRAIADDCAVIFGILKFLQDPQLPIKTTINHLRANCLCSFNDEVFAALDIDGSDFAPLRTANVKIKSTVDVEKLPSMSVKISGDAAINQTMGGYLDNINCVLNCRVSNTKQQEEKNFVCNFCAKKTNQVHRCEFKLGADGSAESICAASVAMNYDEQRLNIDVSHSFDARTVETLAREEGLPRFESNVRVGGELDLKTLNGIVKGSMQVVLDSEIVQLFVPSVQSETNLSVDCGLKMTDGLLEITSLGCVCSGVDDSSKMLCYAVQPLRVWSKQSGMLLKKSLCNARQSIFKLVFDDFRQRFSLQEPASLQLDASLVGEVDVQSKDGVFLLSSTANYPLQFKNLLLTHDGKKCIENANATCAFNLSIGDQIKLSLGNVAMTSTAGSALMDGEFDMVMQRLNFTSNINLNAMFHLEEMCKLPFFSRDIAIDSGLCYGNASVAINVESVVGSGDFKLKDFDIRKSGKPVDGECNFTLSYVPDCVRLNAKIGIDGERDTAANLSMVLDDLTNSGRWDAKIDLSGESLFVPDAAKVYSLMIGAFGPKNNKLSNQVAKQSLEKLFSGASAGGKQKSAITGQLAANFNQVFVSPTLIFENFKSSYSLDSNAIGAGTCAFTIEDSPFNLQSKFRCDNLINGEPYSLSIGCTFESDDVGQICRAADPGREPLITGALKANMNLESKSDSIANLIATIGGTFSAKFSNGSIALVRLLDAKGKIILDSFSVVNSLIAKKDDKLDVVMGALAELQRIKYNSVQLDMACSGNSDIFLNSFQVLGPSISVNANGRISRQGYQSIGHYPISISVKIGVAEKLGEAADRLGLVVDRPKNDKYLLIPNFVLGGNVARPDHSALLRIICSILK